MAATSWNPLNPRIRATHDGGVPEIRKFPEAATQSYKAGTLVYLDATNGRITVCADSATQILGIAQEDASGTTSTLQAVQLIKPGDEIIMQCVTALDDNTQVAASSLKRGFTYDLAVDANIAMGANLAGEHATTEEFIFIEPVYDAAGDSTNYGVFQLEAVAANFGSSG